MIYSFNGRSELVTESEELLLSVHEVEPKISETDRSSLPLANKLGLDEHLSSDDESFHSVYDSYSSDDLSNPDEDLSPIISYRSISSPTDINPPDLKPSEQSTCASPNDQPSSVAKMAMSSQFTKYQIASPPPSEQSTCASPNDQPSSEAKIVMSSPFTKHQIASPPSTSSSSTKREVSSSLNTGSSGANSNQQDEFPQHMIKQASATTPHSTPTPPPPPFKGNSVRPPPPPPGQLAQLKPIGTDGPPLPKLKPFYWDKVRAPSDHSMIWDNIRSSSFKLDEKMMESLFGYNMQKKNETKSKSVPPKKHILETKRLQNLTILSKALNATPEQVCDALMQGKGLSLQQLEVLVKMEPTTEEVIKLLNYQGSINELDYAEKLFMAMLKVPFAFSRIKEILFRDTFEDELANIRKSFAMLEEACKELRSSQLFLKLLEAVLKIGNRMNIGTMRGGARAFKLDALLKLADVKGTDGKTTLLHFVVQEIIRSKGTRESDIIIRNVNLKTNIATLEEKEDEYRRLSLNLLSGMCTELCNVKKTATLDLDVIVSSVSNLSDGMFKLRRLVNDDLSMEHNRRFVHSMLSFMDDAEQTIKELQDYQQEVLLHVREITEYLHGHVSKNEENPLQIFVIVRDFMGMLAQVCIEKYK